MKFGELIGGKRAEPATRRPTRAAQSRTVVRTVAERALTSGERTRLPDSAFCIPERRAWPIPDLAHALVALEFMAEGRGKQSDYPAVRSAIKRKFGQEPGVKARLKESVDDGRTSEQRRQDARAALQEARLRLDRSGDLVLGRDDPDDLGGESDLDDLDGAWAHEPDDSQAESGRVGFCVRDDDSLKVAVFESERAAQVAFQALSHWVETGDQVDYDRFRQMALQVVDIGPDEVAAGSAIIDDEPVELLDEMPVDMGGR